MTSTVFSPVKPVAAILYRDRDLFGQVLDKLAQQLSAIDYRGGLVPFDYTQYYREEMGDDLEKTIVSFDELVSAESLADIKLMTLDIERSMSSRGKRRINIDPGYLDLYKLVLASFKERGHKIYLGKGVWADMTLYFEKGHYHAFPWSFPDFKRGDFDDDLIAIRMLLKTKLNEFRSRGV